MLNKATLIRFVFSVYFMLVLYSCGAVKPKVPAHAVSKKESTGAVVKVDQARAKKSSLIADNNVKNKKQADAKPKNDRPKQSKKQENTPKKLKASKDSESLAVVSNESVSQLPPRKDSYSNYIRVKTVYELAAEANPPMFFPHDEFETASEYQNRVSDQIKLMKEIVQMTSQKMDIKKAQRMQVAKEKELKTKTIIENLMAESSSAIEFTPTDIGRYNAEKETFPVILHNTQYQISVPREEARTFKSNFKSVKIKGIKQLKPQYDVSIKVSKAHIRSRPNGSIVGIASDGDLFEHVQDEDEWYKINYKGQFGFTHMNNASLKLIDIADQYEYHDLVAIHPTTGSMFAMTSVDKLVKAPLNLASRKLYESGQPDGPQ